MRNGKMRAIALTLAAAAIVGLVTPSLAAQTTRSDRENAQDPANAYAQQYPRGNQVQRPMASDGFWAPGNIRFAPNQCWEDDGYGRYVTCDGAGG